MDRRRPWQRVASMFGKRRSGSNQAPVSSRRDRTNREQNTADTDHHTPPAHMISRLFRDIYRSQNIHASPRASLNCIANWSTIIFTASPFGQNVNKFRGYTPKCLSDINCHGLLMGQESYDNFSPSCWLEDHLHQFATVNEDDELEFEEEYHHNEAPSSDENFTLVTVSNQLRVPHDISNVRPGDTFRSIVSSTVSVNSNSSGPGSSSRGSTISDIAHFYNLRGFTPRASQPQPPPYTERSDEDPPPSYTDVFVPPVIEGRQRSSTVTRASNTLLNDILW